MNNTENIMKKPKNDNMKIKGFGLLETIIIIVITAIISGITTGVILFNSFDEKSLNSYKNLTSDKNLKEFLDVYSSVTNEYYKDINKEEMLERAIDAMMNYLGDDYTTYLNKEQTTLLSETLKGKYKGIGISFKDKKVMKVFENSPAESSGLKINDEIIEINGVDCKDLKDDKIVDLIKKQDSKANISVKRNNEILSFDIDIKELNVPAIAYEVIENSIGYIYISTFSNTVAEQVKNAVDKLEKQNIKSLIIDVRDNSGGYLTAAYDIASIFLEKDKIIYSLQSDSEQKVYYDKTDEKRNYKIAVLINGNSASSSEILAAALNESYGAILVGETSYGKGRVQQIKNLSNGKMIKYTSAKWLTPKNNCVDGKGLTPDYEVSIKLPDEKKDDISSFEDTQLKKAIELIKNS